jgi:4-hydroxyphenylacetate 3-hydroxylase N terminal
MIIPDSNGSSPAMTVRGVPSSNDVGDRAHPLGVPGMDRLIHFGPRLPPQTRQEPSMPQAPETMLEGKERPFNGAEFLASLDDGREVHIYGEQVKNVTAHPAFRNAAVSVAQLYDALHDAKTKDVLTAPTDTGSRGYTHKFFKAARCRDEVIAQRDAIAAWARLSYGWMGRSPDYKAAFLNTLGANAEFYGKFADNARAWAGGGALLEPRPGQSADRPQQASRAGQGRLQSPCRRKRTAASSSPAPKSWPPTRR